MKTTKKQTRGLSTRDKIVDAAFTVMSERGLAQASIKEIAAAAEINPGLVHYHFKNKEDVLAAVVRKVAHDIGAYWSGLQEKMIAGLGSLIVRLASLSNAFVMNLKSIVRGSNCMLQR